MNGAKADTAAVGFAGLVDLATTLPPEPKFEPAPSLAPEGRADEPISMSRTVENPKFWTGQRRWYAFLGGAMTFIVAVANWPKDETAYRAPAPSSTYAPSPAQPSYNPTYTPPASTSDQFAESEPAGGAGQILSRSEIRYCLSERVRMDAMGDYVDETKQSHIDRFNALVGDYNARCSNYRYRRSEFDGVKASVDASTQRLKAQAAATVRQWP